MDDKRNEMTMTMMAAKRRRYTCDFVRHLLHDLLLTAARLAREEGST